MLHRRYRHDALMGVAQMAASLLRLHGPGFEQKNAGDDLKTVGNAVLHLLQQHLLSLKQLVLFALSLAAARRLFDRRARGYGPSGLIGVVLVIVLILFLLGKI